MRELVEEYISLWGGSGVTLPPSDRRYTVSEQATAESCLRTFLQTIVREFRDLARRRAGRRHASDRIRVAFAKFAKACLGLDERHIELLLNDGLAGIAASLARRARQIDPSISTADVFQASRNAWTAGALQIFLGQRTHLTPSIFAYSMLYPYSDNYLDDPAASFTAKLTFSDRFRQRLEGVMLPPIDRREATIWRLVDIIEQEYDRAEWPEVYDSLLTIHRAQEDSVRMLHHGSSADADVLKVTFEKGGASVMADAYLVTGSLSHEEARLAFSYGVLLQLIDDIQDLQQDLQQGHRTLFTDALARPCSGSATGESLDDVTTRTLVFGYEIMRQIDHVQASQSGPEVVAHHESLKQLIHLSHSLLPIWSVAKSSNFYTGKYLAKLETRSPFRFAVLADEQQKLRHSTDALARTFECSLQDQDDGVSLLLTNFLLNHL